MCVCIEMAMQGALEGFLDPDPGFAHTSGSILDSHGLLGESVRQMSCPWHIPQALLPAVSLSCLAQCRFQASRVFLQLSILNSMRSMQKLCIYSQGCLAFTCEPDHALTGFVVLKRLPRSL